MRRQRILGPDDSRAPARRKAHGLTADERDYIWTLQGGACAICRRTGLRLELDHDHRHCSGRTGCRQCIRGLLCGRCNAGLGLIGDAFVPRLLRYLAVR
jgi:hypothetical protein